MKPKTGTFTNRAKKVCTGKIKGTVAGKAVHKRPKFPIALLRIFYFHCTESIIKLPGNIRFQTFASNSMIL